MSESPLPLAQGGELSHHVGDAISLGVVVATIAEWLPAVAALLTVIWTAIRIYETRTVQRVLWGSDRGPRAEGGIRRNGARTSPGTADEGEARPVACESSRLGRRALE